MMIGDVSILHHLIAVLGVLWLLSSYLGCTHPLAFVLSFLYLYLVNDRYTQRLRRRLQFEERNNANQSRLLSDAESVRWLNHAIAKVWPICMEQIASQQILLPIIPWFLDKYKPWTAKKATVQHLYLGKDPPVFNKIRVLAQSADDDHLVLEMGMSFLSGDDMSSTLAVQLRKGLGFGMWAKMHMTGMHVEGKVLVGVKFLQHWPFLGRVRMSFVEPPYFQMTVKPIFTHGIDVTELPGIAGWLDRLLSVAFQQTLVEPNMLVVDVEKLVSSPTETWFTMDEKPPAAYAKVEIIEGADMKPSDMNGLADPYVKGRLGNYRFRTKIQWKTLNPKWHESFKIPIISWDEPNILVIEVRDKDRIFDDTLGNTKVDISDMKDGQRYDKWLVLENIKMGRLHLAVTILEADSVKVEEFNQDCDEDQLDSNGPDKENLDKHEPSLEVPMEHHQSKNTEEYEPINIEGQENARLWVHRPGRDVSETWEPRKGSRAKQGDINVEAEQAFNAEQSGSNSSEEHADGKKAKGLSKITKGLKKFGSVLRRSPREGSASNGGSIPPTPTSNRQNNIDMKVIWDRSMDGDEGAGDSMAEHEEVVKGHREKAKTSLVKGIQNVKSALSKKSSKGREDDASGGRTCDAPASDIPPCRSSQDGCSTEAVEDKPARTPSSLSRGQQGTN